MTTLTATQARATLYKLLEQTAASHVPIQITGKRTSAVLIAEEDWRAVMETLYLVSIPGVTESDFTNIDKYNTYVKLLIDGTPSKPFSMKGIKSPTNSDSNIREQVRNINRQTYGRPLIEVEAEISESLKVGQRPPAAGSNGPINNL